MSDSGESDAILHKLELFCEINAQFAIAFKITEKTSFSRCQKNDLHLQYLATKIINIPQYFDDVIRIFSNILPKIVKTVLSFPKGTFNNNQHLQNCVILGKLIEKRPEFEGYASRYFEQNPSPFIEDKNLNQTPAKKSKISSSIPISDLDLVESCFSLLKSNPRFYRTKWNWSIFVENYLNHKEPEVQWIACHCLAKVAEMSEKRLRNLIISKLSEDRHIEFSCEYSKNQTLSKRKNKNKVHIDQKPCVSIDKKSIVISDVVEISGVYLPKLASPAEIKDDLVLVESTKNNLKKIALGLSSNAKAICLQGHVGSGKTTLIEYLARKTGRILGQNFVKVQLGDQTDSKMLLGTYRCTDIPGEFVWQPGVVTQAVVEGNWLLLEDIDSTSMDIASVLSSLLENETLTVPGYRDSLAIKPGFQLFFTQRLISTLSGHHKRHSNAMTLLEKNLLQIHIDPLPNDELKEILTTLYPQFARLSDRMLKVFRLFSRDSSDTERISVPKTSRLISTRDFFKWCARASVDFDVSSQSSALKVLQDAIDVFCCSYSNRNEALTLAKDISSILGIVNEKAEYFFDHYKPDMHLTSDCLVVGRANIERNDSLAANRSSYFFTRPSAVLLERIMCCVSLNEPVLLVGETGTGKTSSVQYLANAIGQKLIVINMNQQSDSADLLGGYKPVDLKFIVAPIRREFEHVFSDYFQVGPNQKFLKHISVCFNESRWGDLTTLMIESYKAALKRIGKAPKSVKNSKLLKRWQKIGEKLQKLNSQIKQANSLAFAFIEGSLVKAVEEGHWVLLDEINLANAETLECLSGLLEGPQGSLCLLERGDKEPSKRHKNFTLFACMNPSTDVGKKDLPPGLRNRFTEFYVDELTEKSDLLLLTASYLNAQSLKQADVNKIVDFYLKVRKEAAKTLSDGLGHCPHFSLRSLCRALVVTGKNPCGTFKRSLYEAFCLSFLTQLDAPSYLKVESMIARNLIGDEKSLKSITKQPIPAPNNDDNNYLQFEGYWVRKGGLDCVIPEDYILTDSVRKNLRDLVRIVSIGGLPVLLQGDTSVGKTSLITYLAKSSGNKCVRINNHEHTDLQEYIGSYVADVDGKLVFREGVLVEAMRKGHWIILDELNLAPTDVLEALNRVLDDNRELFIPETQETVKADPNFMLFATQNPPGSYGGRKMLSRAFRNRFVELHFNEIPPQELAFILHQRCQMAPSYAKKMIDVMTDLQTRRRGSAAFAGKQGFITLRDLFRWGERYRLAQNNDKLYDWDQHLADEGYLVLAGRVRKIEEKQEIIQVLQKHLKRSVDPQHLFTLSDKTSTVTLKILTKIQQNQEDNPNIVWTFNMRQLAVLVCKAFEFKEPALLVGETGGGKTTVCQLIANQNRQKLLTVNCHMHTESSDFIGGLRPVRDHSDSSKLFEWIDGPLIQAMSTGDVFLADEISLADDSVLERLNSLLEPERTLLLAEKGSDLNNPNNSEIIEAHRGFRFIGTMNPGGDFGKKELSPALRNRFTEIWCESCTDRDDLIAIVERNIKNGISFGNQQDGSSGIGKSILDFVEWFRSTEIGARFTISIRDILTWVNFINTCAEEIDVFKAYLHGACLTFLDGLGSGITATENRGSLTKLKSDSFEYLTNQIRLYSSSFSNLSETNTEVKINNHLFGIEPFYVEIGDDCAGKVDFSFTAPTTLYNTLRLLRGMQLHKAILLEGSPGVGKTSLVTALAKITRHKIFRVNLSDQTDISDLFGADLPVEGGTGGQFSWRDGPLLQALKSGDWILLDELNLASQSVLEGLNACLDHRGEIFIPELGKTFTVKPKTRFFACQNPLKQGGSRRGLPRSFLNRFVQVYVDSLNFQDLEKILTHQFPQLPHLIIHKMLEFNFKISVELDKHNFGHKGSPWELNLRDVTRWCESTLYHQKINNKINYHPENLVRLIYSDRMRTLRDKTRIGELFSEIFSGELSGDGPILYVSSSKVWLGDVCVNRDEIDANFHSSVSGSCNGSLVLRSQLAPLRSLAYCVNLNWMAILVGNAASGKSALVRTLADLAGKSLKTLPVTSAMDTTDILGGFEQTDYARHLEEIVKETERLVFESVQNHVGKGKDRAATGLLRNWEDYLNTTQATTDVRHQTMEEETKLFLEKLRCLDKVWRALNPNDDDNNPVKILKDKVEIMKLAVENEGSLNAGGKFEWVDSVLIKCLQKGEWLLVDNVNLCSAAVLDRLNALLEPNGVLIISERGVDSQGKMIEIKPHPQFRLFLTMDPKNGEISRAMRNRGVEIYLLNDKEMDLRDDYDFKSLISSAGLNDEFHISSLLSLHDFISNMVLGDKPNINELLRASSSIAQLIRNGEEPKTAFVTSSIEVYYKNRSQIEFDCDNFKESIADFVENRFSVTDYWFDDRVTLKTGNLKMWPELEKIRQQFSQIPRHLEAGGDFLKFLLVHFYSISSLDDLNVRRVYSRDFLNSSRLFDGISSVLFQFLKGLKLDPSDLPVDLRWIPETPSANNNTKSRSSTNATILTLHLLATFHREKVLFANSGKKKKDTSLYEYLQMRKSRKIDDEFDDFLIDEFLNLMDEYDNYLLSSLKSNKIVLSDGDFIEVLDLITWRLILMRCTLVNIAKIDQSTRNEIKTKLKIHYRWFLKISFRKIISLLNLKPPKQLENIVNSIEEHLEHQFSNLHGISKIFQKGDARPLPKTNQAQIDFGSNSFEIDKELDVCRKNCDLKEIISILYRNENRKDLLLNPSLVSIDLLRTEGGEIELNEIEMASLPFCDYFAQIVVRKLILNNEIHENSQLLRRTVTIPLSLVRSLLNYGENCDSKLKHEVLRNLFRYYGNSACIQPKQYSINNAEKLTVTNPILTFNLLNLLLLEDGNNVTQLGNFRENGKQRRLLHLTLWRNLGQLNDENFDFLKNELDFLKKSFKDFMSQFSQVLNLDLNSDYDVYVNKLKSLKIDQIFINRFESCVLIHKNLDYITQCDEIIRSVSLLHMELSYLKAQMNSKLPLIDPSAKKYLKKEYCLENLGTFEKLAESFVVMNEVYSGSAKTLHSLHKPTLEKIANLKEKHEKLGSFVAFRPKGISYEQIFDLIDLAFTTILSPKSVDEMLENFAIITEDLTDLKSSKSVSFLKKLESKMLSLENLLDEWVKYSHCYPDIVDPLLCNISEFLYGLKLSTSLLSKLIWKGKHEKFGWDVQQKLIDLVKSPTFEQQVEFYTDKKFGGFIQEILQNEANPNIHKQEMLKLFKCGFQETFNNCLIHAEIAADSMSNNFANFDKLLRKFVNAWTEQEKEREIRENEAESLYKAKTKCDDKPEEEQIADELKELFPNYHDLDFSDLQKSKSLDDDNNDREIAKTEKFSGYITEKDLKFVLDLHLDLVTSFSKSEWLKPVKNKNLTADFVHPLVEKLKLFKQICDKIAHCLDYRLDKELLGSANVLLVFVRNYGDFSSLSQRSSLAKKTYDFYKDPNVEEVKSCFHILEELRRRILQLLSEWPDQPTLKTIQTIIDRVYGFDIASPLSRFLTALEILLAKCKEWEEVAHSGVTLSEHSQELTQQIISWRKIELNIWKDLLDSTFEKVNEPIYKWWLHLYNIMIQFIEERIFNEQELIETLQNFIAKSSLGEFQKRLQLFYAFHCHTLYLNKSEYSEAFRNILWNLYSYFKQFEGTVVNKIKDLRSPIEKKLKDYVKIVRWKDINYWAIKETVDKSHKTLHKYVREFRDVLRQPVSSCLVNTSASDKKEKSKTCTFILNPVNYIMAKDYCLKMKIPSAACNIENSVLNKIDSYFTKSRKLCKDTISAMKYSHLLENLDDFLTDVIETSSHLQNLEVDTTLAKDKQKSQAKTILQQKHRALADLFKTLSKIGLSFRTGMVESKIRNESAVYLLKPIDISASFSHLNYNKRIIETWENCEKYYLRSMMRTHVLDTALKTPAPDLGIPNIERCKGFTSHLMSLTQKHKSELIETSRNFYYLRHFTTQIAAICGSQQFISLEIVVDFQTILADLRKVSYQLEIILQTCPEDEFGDSEQLPELIILKPEPDNFPKFKHDAVWTRASKLLSEIVNVSGKISNCFQKSKDSIPSAEFELISPEFVPISDRNLIDGLLMELIHNIDAFMTIFDEISFCDSLQQLRVKLAQLINRFNNEKSPRETQSVENLGNLSENLAESILIVIQNIFKKYNKSTGINVEENLEEGHLSKEIFENLLNDSKVLDIEQILSKVQGVSKVFFKIPPNQLEESKSIVGQTLPLLEQLILLYEYFLTQEVQTYRLVCKMNSILLNIFIELTSKGFCVPLELQDENSEEGVSKPSDGLGLGEGQGEKDVSDKIESEDQLDDAKPAGEEKEKEQDPDCREENGGIEMSEDFDSKLQDVEQKEGDDEDDDKDDDNSDADEQMGETGKDSDKLDQEIWGSDNEEEEEENDKENQDEDGDQGDKESEQQLGAKEDDKNQPQDKDDQDASKEKEEKQKEINEMKEPEFDEEQTDPYHGNQPELPEPEPMDLPDDLQLDEGQENENEDGHEENPFDVDAMKEDNPFEKKEEDEEVNEQDEAKEFDSEDEDIENTEGEKNPKESDETPPIEENDQNESTKELDDEVPEETGQEEEERSGLDQTQTNEDNIEAMEVDDVEATDKTDSTQNQNQKSNQPIDEICQEDKPDKEGVGQSQMEESSTGHSAQTTKPQEAQTSKRQQEDDFKKPQKPGDSNTQRSLGDVNEPVKKKLKTMDTNQQEDGGNEDEENADEEAAMYEHIKDAKDKSTQVLDVATKEQAEAQHKEGSDLNEKDENEDLSDLLPEDPVEDEDVEMLDQTDQKAEKTEAQKKNKKNDKNKQHPDGDVLEELNDVDVEGEVVDTFGVSRGGDSTHHTLFGNLGDSSAQRLTFEEITTLRVDVEKQLSAWSQMPSDAEAEAAWQKISSVTSSLAQDLSEQLRLVLEPTQASRLRGDFRTGRRINMRKVIPYIASQFRKDKIWLRRTKPSKRDYQIALAIDDSSSMADNRSKELAFESVALISKSLSMLESGELSVLSFGENTEILHKLSDQFTDRSGVKLLQKFRFDQNKTCIGKLVDFAVEMFDQNPARSTAVIAKLLIIVSDGRGVFSEGESFVREAVRRAKLSEVFMVFVIVDNPENKHSVLDIRMPTFKDGKLLEIQSYMDVFPFGFYIILRDINSLPSVLSDALRQWFEIVTNLDKQ